MTNKEFKPDKSRFKDEKGRYIVQGLFLEDDYNTSLAVYTLAGEDKNYHGVIYPSLKRLYLEAADPEEYVFASTYLYDWPHWQRMCKNVTIGREIDKWREELALSLRSEGIATLIHLAKHENSYQAAKWLADEGWVKQKRGRPSKEQIEKAAERKAAIEEQYKDDFQLLTVHKGDKNG